MWLFENGYFGSVHFIITNSSNTSDPVKAVINLIYEQPSIVWNVVILYPSSWCKTYDNNFRNYIIISYILKCLAYVKVDKQN